MRRKKQNSADDENQESCSPECGHGFECKRGETGKVSCVEKKTDTSTKNIDTSKDKVEKSDKTSKESVDQTDGTSKDNVVVVESDNDSAFKKDVVSSNCMALFEKKLKEALINARYSRISTRQKKIRFRSRSLFLT
jgi:hypothetical protein